MIIISKILNRGEFNKEQYFKYRRIAIGEIKGYPTFLRKIYLAKVKRINRRFASNIYTELEHGAKFETVPILPHDLCGIFIASTAVIGKNCTILQQVTIGGNPKTHDGKSPISKAAVIGDNVIISAGAKIIGDVKIGNNVVIGANAVVLRDIPDNCIAVGVPARIIEKREK